MGWMSSVGGHEIAAGAPHLLYVAWGFPPSRGSGMYRALATANAFVSRGWKVTVLTASRETFERLTGTDPESEDLIDPRIGVVRIPFDPSRGETDLLKWSRFRVFSQLAWNVARWATSWIQFPERGYGVWSTPLIRAAEQIHHREPVSLVIGTANPNVDFVVGGHLARKFGVPFVMDYRDAWHLDVYTGKRIRSVLGRSARIEMKLLRSAVEVWFVNKPIRDWHAQRFARLAPKFKVVANGFDPDLLDRIVMRPSRRNAGLVFGYLGTIYGPIPLRETLEGWKLARAESALVRDSTLIFRGRLGHFSEPDSVSAAMIAEYSGEGVTYGGPVSKTQVADVYSDFDVLLLIISRSRFVTSGKVFEYAATGRPIASIHHPDTAASDVLRGYPLHVAVDDTTPRAIASALIEIGEIALKSTADDIQGAKTWATSLSRDSQLAPRIEALFDFVTNRSELK